MEPMIAAVVGLAVGAAVFWLAKRGEIARISAARDQERARADAASNDLATERAALAASRTKLEEVERAHGEKIESLERVRSDIEKELKALAQQALKENQTSFIGLANEVFDKHRERVDGELKPIKTALSEWRKNLEEIEKERRRGPGEGPGRGREARQCAPRGAQDARAMGRGNAQECSGAIGHDRVLRLRNRAVAARG